MRNKKYFRTHWSWLQWTFNGLSIISDWLISNCKIFRKALDTLLLQATRLIQSEYTVDDFQKLMRLDETITDSVSKKFHQRWWASTPYPHNAGCPPHSTLRPNHFWSALLQLNSSSRAKFGAEVRRYILLQSYFMFEKNNSTSKIFQNSWEASSGHSFG